LFYLGIAIGFVILHLILSAALQLRSSTSETLDERLREVGRLRTRLNRKVLVHNR